MKKLRRNLVLLLSLLMLCSALPAVPVMAESTNLIYNGNMNEPDWFYTLGPAGWELNKTTDIFVKSLEEFAQKKAVAEEKGETFAPTTVYIYHQNGGINDSPYMEIDAATYESGDGEPKITRNWIENLQGNTWYTLTFYFKKLAGGSAPKVKLTFASDDGGTAGAIDLGTGLVFMAYEEGWLKYQIRFYTPSWAWKMQLGFGAITRNNAKANVAYDEFSLIKDETCVEYMETPAASIGNDCVSAWPNTTAVTLSDANKTVMPIATLGRRVALTERPENGLMRAAFYYNAVNSKENVTCISAVYLKTNEGTTLIDCYIDELVREAEINRLEQEITLPEAGDGEEYIVKSFIWDSASGLKSCGVSNAFSYTKNTEAEEA